MAWISVHETIDGPKLRSLRKTLGCSKFEAAGILIFLWLWGLRNADKSGYVMYAEEEDIISYLSGHSTGCKFSVEKIMNALIETDWLEKEDGSPLRLHDWEDWQKEWYKYQAKLETDRNSKRKKKVEEAVKKTMEPSLQADPLLTENGVEVLSIEEKQEKPVAQRGKEYSASFRKVYEIYPRKGDKAQAYKAYCARLKDGYSEDEMYIATENYAKKMRKERTEERYIKSAKTFFGSSTPFEEFIPAEIREVVQDQDDGNPYSEWGG